MPNSNHSGSSLNTSPGVYDSDSGNGGGDMRASMHPGPRVKKDQGRKLRNKAVRVSFAGGDLPRAELTTSLKIANVPPDFTQGALVSMLGDLTPCMRGNFDFFYCPWDVKNGRNAGYAVINFLEEKYAAAFQGIWQNKELIGQKLRVGRNNVQGQRACIEHFLDQGPQHADARFRPLYRDHKGELVPVMQDGAGRWAESQDNSPVSTPERPVREVDYHTNPPVQGLTMSYGEPPWSQLMQDTTGAMVPLGMPYPNGGYPCGAGEGVDQLRGTRRNGTDGWNQHSSADIAAGPQTDTRGQQQVQVQQVVCYMMVPVEAMMQGTPQDGSGFPNRAVFPQIAPGALGHQAVMSPAAYCMQGSEPWEAPGTSHERNLSPDIMGA